MAGIFRNRKKKTYSYNRSQALRIVSSSVGGSVEYYDETLLSADYPFFVLDLELSQAVIRPPPATWEYDENVVDFDWTDSKSVGFSFTFSARPIITVEILPAGGWENVGIFVRNVTAAGCEIDLSAPLSGQVVYRAIQATPYPTVVSRSVASSSYFYTASAGTLGLVYSDTGMMSYYALGGPGVYPTNMFVTVIDSYGYGDADVAVVATGSYGLTNTPVSLSAPIVNHVNYLAVK